MRSAIVATCLLIGAATASGQFKDIWKSTRDGIKETLKKQTQEQTGATPTGSPRPVSPSMPAAGKAAKEADEPLWPNLAVDPQIVQEQQQQLREHCEPRKASSPQLDCECMVRQYPEFRLRQLSRHIRQAEREKDSGCKRDPEKCSVYSLSFEWITNPETQKKFPTAENRPRAKAGPSIFSPPSQFRQFIPTIYLYLGKTCVDSAAIGDRAENDCQEAARSGLLSGMLKPGMSTNAFCACTNEKVAAGMPQSEAYVACSK